MAWLAWSVSALFVVACVAVDGVASRTTTLGMALCTVAIITAAAAATLHVKSFFCSTKDSMERAFQIGRDKGRLEALEERDVPLQRVR
jgi:hypothetical protein